MANLSCMAANVAASQALNKSIRKTSIGAEKDFEDGRTHIKCFKFEPEDIGKFVVVKFRYQESFKKLSINYNVLNTRNNDMFYGVYKICYHDWCESTKDISYKIHLQPVDWFVWWCPDCSYYVTDLESIINKEYNLFEENPVFDTEDEALKFAMNKNFELYPDTRSIWRKIKDRLFN